MKPLWIGMIVFVCTLAGALFGMWLRATLPPEHLRDESRDTVRLGIGLVATLTALVLGLMTASAKSSFDTLNTSIRSMAADVIATDRLLARYGPETKDVRETLKRVVARRIDEIWSDDPSRDGPKLAVNKESETAEWIVDQIRAMTPSTAAQRSLQSRASDQAETVLRSRWVVLGERHRDPLAVSHRARVLAHDHVHELRLAGAGERHRARRPDPLCALGRRRGLPDPGDGRPFDGLIQVSSEPVRFALTRLGQ